MDMARFRHVQSQNSGPNTAQRSRRIAAEGHDLSGCRAAEISNIISGPRKSHSDPV
jgi:hypothetical protein